ncbi:hypothetical protein RBH26_19465 [Natronolimnohabitans sp. A-GB9]|uniref:hypothetical protein n=1 Tax=Natronolimnohabitans sp. A-GB9 TaxID=3069757 RepID=UPI0027AF557F|nr:hypothetical protein [Natronolimnohabitans sp. A-GB9]MDQ2052640.1 hypothetical protein [Natronolimnohabitans sp. A-GB9]
MVSLAVAIVFVWLVIRSSSLTSRRFEQLAPDALLTTVPVRAVVLGLTLFILARLGAVLAVPTLGVAIGLALGTGSPGIAISVIVAILILTTLAVGVGTAGRLASILVGRRLVRGNLYKSLLVLFGWVPFLVLFLLLREFSIPIDQLITWFDWLPLVLIGDLALLGAGEQAGVEPLRGLGAIAAVALVVPFLLGLTTVFTRRLWETDPGGSTQQSTSSQEDSLGNRDWLGGLLSVHIPRPTITMARERLLTERRVPRGLLNTAYVVLIVGVVGFPLFAIFAAPGFLLLVFALGIAIGIVFGSEPISKSYKVLPMLLTTIRGRDFVGGHVLASLIVGIPLITIVVVPLGVVSDASFVETIVLTLTGVVLCACTASVNIAFGMGVNREDLVPVPGFFTNVPLYGEMGWAAFSGLIKTFAVVSVVLFPALLGNSQLIYGQLEPLGFPTAIVRIGGLCITILLALGVSKIAFGIAVNRYHNYAL